MAGAGALLRAPEPVRAVPACPQRGACTPAAQPGNGTILLGTRERVTTVLPLQHLSVLLHTLLYIA